MRWVTPKMSQRHFMWNVLSFLKSFCVMVQVSAPYNSTDITKVKNSHFSTHTANTFDFSTLLAIPHFLQLLLTSSVGPAFALPPSTISPLCSISIASCSPLPSPLSVHTFQVPIHITFFTLSIQPLHTCFCCYFVLRCQVGLLVCSLGY